MKPTSFFDFITTTQQFLAKKRQRRLLVLKGDKNWAKSLLAQLPSFSLFMEHKEQNENTKTAATWLLFSEQFSVTPSLRINAKNYRHFLGTECDYLLFDGESFNVDAFAALSGTIKAGGLLFLLWPEKAEAEKLHANSLFLQRFDQQLFKDNEVIIIEPSTSLLEPAQHWQCVNENNVITPTSQNSAAIGATLPLPAYGCATVDQQRAVEAIEKVFSGHRNRPLVLTADRGRGKSSALAIACARLIKTAKQSINITITAPHQQALSVFFQQLKVSLPHAHHEQHKLIYCHNSMQIELTFVPVDKLIHDDIKTHFLLVDEAGAIPVYLLTALLQRYHRIVFSTTLHGYEGAGRGFTLKFLPHLKKIRPEFKTLHLNQPIRWAKADPLERFVFNSCLLNAELGAIETRESLIKDSKDDFFQLIDRASLASNEALLRQVFSVLVTAHYQTSPSDLALMLDNPKISIVAISRNNQVIAVALLIAEGNCTTGDVKAIAEGQRRLKDQFTPQSLLTHCGFKQAFNYRYLRIMRIAVHPSVQQQGIGSYFLGQISLFAQKQSFDFLATSFGATTTLLHFWLRNDYRIARVGFNKDHASGEHSVLLLNALNKQSKLFQGNVQQHFYRSFAYLLTDEYQTLATPIATLLLRYCPREQSKSVATIDQQVIEAFANKKQLYAASVYSLHLALLRYLATEKNINEQAVLAIVARVLQKQPVNSLCKQYGFTGKKAFNQYMVDFVNTYLKRLT